MVKGVGAGFSKGTRGVDDQCNMNEDSDMHRAGKTYDGIDMELTKSILVEISSDIPCSESNINKVHTITGIASEFIRKMNDRASSKCMMDISEKVVRANAASNVQTTFNKATLVLIWFRERIHSMGSLFANGFAFPVFDSKKGLEEVFENGALDDPITMGIPLLDGFGFSKETVRVEYEWKPPQCDHCKIFGHVDDQCPKNAMNIPTIDMTNDGFQVVVNKQKMNHGNSPKNRAPNMSTSTKDGSKPSSSFYSASSKKGDRKAPTNLSNMPTSNPYDLLSQEFDPENYTRSRGDPNLVQGL
ncbi:hypothetical protein Tco_0876937 [Tanacetum coccineum]|uniref:Zinc knuckle CX2CX4HX4C n=1 Tax=Tanacetum coccineum TaxID=301880 RepID=A0ABQ5BTQ2_9ASTR